MPMAEHHRHSLGTTPFRLGAIVLWASLVPAAGLCAPAAPTKPIPTLTQEGSRVQDTLGQRLQACTPCHGKEGVATPSGYFPRIAGKPQGYLFEQLLNFQEGRRGHAAMRHLVQPLSAPYLREISVHFAELELPYAPPERLNTPPEVLQRGRQLALEGDAARQLPACAACHGSRLTGALPATPGLLGLSKDYLSAQLGAWRNGLRKAREPDCMKQISDRLADADIHAVTAYLASQPLTRNTRAADDVQAPAQPLCAAPRPS
jgi:cytochrome c553